MANNKFKSYLFSTALLASVVGGHVVQADEVTITETETNVNVVAENTTPEIVTNGTAPTVETSEQVLRSHSSSSRSSSSD